MDDESGTIVYVGHLPYTFTEEQIKDIFKTVGPVKDVRLVFDRATGKSKGFAFVHYFKPESAQSAVRNLNNYKVGNLPLRVSLSSGRDFGRRRQNRTQDGPQDSMSPIERDIVDIVASVPPQQKRALILELKQFVAANPQAAEAVFDRNPQLSYAVMQSLFELNLVDGDTAPRFIVPQNQQKEREKQNAGGSQKAKPPTSAPQSNPNASAPIGGPTGAPTAPPVTKSNPRAPAAPELVNPAQQAQMLGRHKRGRLVPPVQTASSQATGSADHPAQSQPQPQTQPSGGPKPQLSEETKAIYRQIMMLTPDQFAAMSLEQQHAAMQIKTQIASGKIVL